MNGTAVIRLAALRLPALLSLGLLLGLAACHQSGLGLGTARAAPQRQQRAGQGKLADPVVYISGFGPDVERLQFDRGHGLLYAPKTERLGGLASYLALPSGAHRLYAVDEQEAGGVQAFAIKPGAPLHRLGWTAAGSGPAFVTTAGAGRWVLTANYGDGVVRSLDVRADGTLRLAAKVFAGRNAHAVLLDPSERFAFVPCLGEDYIAQYRFDAHTGALTPNVPATIALPAHAGPRHLALHPSGRFAYLINELSSEVTVLSLDADHGWLQPVQTLSTLPLGYVGVNSGAEIAVHPNGRFVYASNRGDNKLAVFAVDPAEGRLTPVASYSSNGQTPRSFTIDPSGRWLLAVNQLSADVTVFKLDPASGALDPVYFAPTTISAPTFIGLAQ